MWCYLDLDIGSERARNRLAALFVHKTSIKYGLRSNDLRKLSGSELARVEGFFASDFEWGNKGDILLRRQQARLVFELFPDAAPLACENFSKLCAGNNKDSKLKYEGCHFHRIVSGFIAQAGDMQFGNGTGGKCVFAGKSFKDEKKGLKLKHDHRGVLSMGNSGKNSNTSQFFITLAAQGCPQLDGKHVVFGRLLSGFECLDRLEELAASESGKPNVSVEITGCGLFTPGQDPAAGYVYDLPDDEDFSGYVKTFISHCRVAIIAPSPAVFGRFVKSLSGCVATLAADAVQAAELLNTHAVDLVIVAPVLADSAPPELANCIVSAPAAAMSKIREWVVVNWANNNNMPGWANCSLDSILK